MNDAEPARLRCLGIPYRAGFIEVLLAHPRHVNLEVWMIHPDSIREDATWVTEVSESGVTGNTEIELDLRTALELADALQTAAHASAAGHLTRTICDECGSIFAASDLTMSGLCPECAHYLYGRPNCAHSFREGRCRHCLWDGSVSEYIASIKGTQRAG